MGLFRVCKKTLLSANWILYCKRCSGRLVEVGQLETPRRSGTYPSGQLFVHKRYGYRGVVLFPWTAKVYDRDTQPESRTFYSALMDERDSPLVRAGMESVTVLGDLSTNRSQYEVPGLDYVDHRDLLPYRDTACPEYPLPLHHSSLAAFLTLQPHSDPPFKAKPTLKIWERKTRPWMNGTEVYRETTELVRVTVIPFYLGSRLAGTCTATDTDTHHTSHVWRYHLSLENLGPQTIQVIDSLWCVFTDCTGVVSERSAWGWGREPVLTSRQPALQYCGHATLHGPSITGYMFGYFRLALLEDGHRFVCRSPILKLKMCPPMGECSDNDLSC